MDNPSTTSIEHKDGERFSYKKLYTIDGFLEKYGEDNCTIMLQDQERVLYAHKIAKLAAELENDHDWEANVQVALDAWKPCDDRPPTEIEAMVQRLLGMPDQVQAQLYRLIEAGLSEKAEEKARVDAEKATEQSQTIDDKFQPPADIGPPVTQPQQEPPAPASFEEIGQQADHAAGNAKAVEAAEAVHAADIEASGEDLRAPTAFEEGGLEGATEEAPAETEVGMPPQQTE